MTSESSRIRVLFPFVGGEQLGGSHISALMLIRNLDKDRFDPRILIHRPDGPFAAMLNDTGEPFETLPDVPLLRSRRSIAMTNTTGLGGYFVRTVPALRAALARIDPDIVHTNDGRMHVNWALPTRMAGKALLWHHRQDPSSFGVNRIAPVLANKIVSVSHYARPDHPLRDISDRFEVAYSPFEFVHDRPDAKAARSALCKELGIAPNALILGYFGTLIVRKRPDYFARVIAELQKQMPETPVHGVIFGETSDSASRLDQKTQDVARSLGIADHVHLMGFRSPIEPFMAGVDALLITALYEPFGRTLIEAMYLGTPVIAVNHGGNTEAIRHEETGFLVDPYDPAAFVEPVRKLTSDAGLRQRMVDAAQQDVTHKYGRDKHVAQLSEIYDALASRNG